MSESYVWVGKTPMKDGTNGFAAMSYFQKSIRRGKELWALYWARQFWLTGKQFNMNPTWRPPLDPAAYGDGSQLEKPVLPPEEQDDFDDKHTGCREGKDLQHFLERGAKLENESDVEGFTPPDHQ